jgi:FtsH-binding integral membrane protein
MPLHPLPLALTDARTQRKPTQVKHFLLIGCLGMLVGSCVFLWLSMSRPKSSLPHVLMFMASAISCMAFYAMWTGVGVE